LWLSAGEITLGVRVASHGPQRKRGQNVRLEGGGEEKNENSLNCTGGPEDAHGRNLELATILRWTPCG